MLFYLKIMAPVIIFASLGSVIVLWRGIEEHLDRRERSRDLEDRANRLGMRFTKKDKRFVERFIRWELLGRSRNCYAANIIEGEYRGYPVKAFEFHYNCSANPVINFVSGSEGRLSFFLLLHEKDFPGLLVCPRAGDFSVLGLLTNGLANVELESSEFDEAFRVQSDVERFAFDVCNTDMMEYLLEHPPGTAVEFQRNCLAMKFSTHLEPGMAERYFEQLVEIRERMPEYLFRA